MFGFDKIVLSATVAFFLFKIFAQGAPSLQSNQNDEIVTIVVDMNSANSTDILSQFNISREDVQRKLNQANDSNAEDESRR